MTEIKWASWYQDKNSKLYVKKGRLLFSYGKLRIFCPNQQIAVFSINCLMEASENITIYSYSVTLADNVISIIIYSLTLGLVVYFSILSLV